MSNRREFIKKSALTTAGIAVGGMALKAKSYRNIQGANDRINIAVIGIRGQGGTHINSFASIKDTKNVQIIALCDVDEQYFDPKSKIVAEKTGITPKTEWDMRRIFENKDIHAVSFAVPNHWHALGTVWACQAGKHVYVEKPACHGIWEGRKMVEAARKYNVRVQTGTQNRSIQGVIDAITFLHKGGIGEVFMAKGTCYKPRDSFGIAPDSNPPASLHYDMWLGPAQMRPYNEKRVHYNWHWFWATGGGDTANQGPHQFDIARWGLNKDEHPLKVFSMGNVFGINPKECEQETPNTQTSLFKYRDGKILEFETRGRYTNTESDLKIDIGNLFYGTEGWMEINGGNWAAYRQREKTPFAGSGIPVQADKAAAGAYLAAPGGAAHYENFIDAIRSGKNEDLHADILEGYMSACLPAMANISYRLGRELTFDGSAEKFVNDKEANAFLKRNYRAPYVIPEKI